MWLKIAILYENADMCWKESHLCTFFSSAYNFVREYENKGDNIHLKYIFIAENSNKIYSWIQKRLEGGT